MKKQLKQSTVCNTMAIVSCVMALLIFLSGMLTASLFIKVSNLNAAQADLISNMRQLVTMVNYQKDIARSYTQDGNDIFLEMYHKENQENHEIDSILADMAALTADPQGKLQFQAIVQYVDGIRAAEQNIISAVQANKLEEARALAFGQDYGMQIDGMNQAIVEFNTGMNRGIGEIIKKQSQSVMQLGILIEVLCVLLILIQISNAVITKKLIIKPLLKLKTTMTDMSAGHLSAAMNMNVDNTEIGQLAGAMLDMRTRISDYIKEIDSILHRISQKDITAQVQNQYVGDFEPIHTSLNLIITSLSETFSALESSIHQISDGAEHVSLTAQNLSQGASEQTNSVERLSSDISRISAQINANVTNATEANTFAITAGASLNTSNQQMSAMVTAMTDIRASSDEIAKIIKTIEDIAFQTNILALNAAVEAARAGSAGRGFAVVADEVRNLANKSAEAAKQTNILIEKSVKTVENGVKIADETANSLSDVVTGSLAMADLITKITQASNEQAVSILQINEEVEQISAVVRTNSITSQQSAATSEELSGQADMMKSMVDMYKIL